MASLRQPGCKRARNDAEHGCDDHDSKERRLDRECGAVARREWIERNGHEIAIGECKTEQDNRAKNENGDFQETNHTSLIPRLAELLRVQARAMVPTILKRIRVAIETLAHFFSGLEERRQLFSDGNLVARSGIAAGARPTLLRRERAETAQLDALAARERICDLAENCVDDVLNVALIEMRIASRHPLDKFRLDHRMSPTRKTSTFATPSCPETWVRINSKPMSSRERNPADMGCPLAETSAKRSVRTLNLILAGPPKPGEIRWNDGFRCLRHNPEGPQDASRGFPR